MKRQRGRNRGGGGGGGGGGKPQAQNANRAFDSNGPEGTKVRGNAQHVFEKYQQLARDASAAGDRVLGENYLQHAEHYFRLLRAMQPTRPASEILGRDHFSSGFDIDFEDESAQAQSEAADAASAEAGDTSESWQNGQPRENGAGGEPRRDDRPRDGQQRDDRPRDDQRPRYENRDRNDGGGALARAAGHISAIVSVRSPTNSCAYFSSTGSARSAAKSRNTAGRNAGTLRDSAPAYPSGRPDSSKLLRATEDALTTAGIYRDDERMKKE